MGFWHPNANEANRLIDVISATEIGRIVARDIGGSDPERMAAANVLAYVNDIFKSTDIKVILLILLILIKYFNYRHIILTFLKISVVEGQDEFEKNYPSFAAVNRAANCNILFQLLQKYDKKLIKTL